jgi:hypothetical protein
VADNRGSFLKSLSLMINYSCLEGLAHDLLDLRGSQPKCRTAEPPE